MALCQHNHHHRHHHHRGCYHRYLLPLSLATWHQPDVTFTTPDVPHTCTNHLFHTRFSTGITLDAAQNICTGKADCTGVFDASCDTVGTPKASKTWTYCKAIKNLSYAPYCVYERSKSGPETAKGTCKPHPICSVNEYLVSSSPFAAGKCMTHAGCGTGTFLSAYGDKAGTCTACANTNCTITKYRTGTCNTATKGYTCTEQPTCSTTQYLDGATQMQAGRCVEQPVCSNGQALQGSDLKHNKGRCSSCPSGNFVDSGVCTACLAKQCDAGTYMTGQCAGDEDNRQCLPCDNTVCKSGEYRTGVCNAAKNDFSCKAQPECPSGQYLDGATPEKLGVCMLTTATTSTPVGRTAPQGTKHPPTATAATAVENMTHLPTRGPTASFEGTKNVSNVQLVTRSTVDPTKGGHNNVAVVTTGPTTTSAFPVATTPRESASDHDTKEDSGASLGVILGLVGAVLLIACIIGVFVVLKKRSAVDKRPGNANDPNAAAVDNAVFAFPANNPAPDYHVPDFGDGNNTTNPNAATSEPDYDEVQGVLGNQSGGAEPDYQDATGIGNRTAGDTVDPTYADASGLIPQASTARAAVTTTASTSKAQHGSTACLPTP